MAFTGTPAAEATEGIVRAQFAGRFRGIGQYKRRLIAGTQTWSQHSWANGLDIYTSPAIGTIAEGDWKVNGDAIAQFLRDNRELFGIRYILWWVRNHYDHIHVDFWPKGVDTPPSSGTGIGSFAYSNGGVVQSKIQEVPAEGTFDGYSIPELPDTGEEDMIEFITDLQEDLNTAGFTDYEDKPLTVDGVYGKRTRSAHQKMILAAAAGTTPVSVAVNGSMVYP